MTGLDGAAAIGRSLETHFGLKKYLYIIQAVQADGFDAGREFRRAFNGYFKVRQRSPQWYERYYGLMAEQKERARTFEEMLWLMAEEGGRVEASFVSKLMAAVDPALPIWDQYVLKNIGEDGTWRRFQGGQSRAERIECASGIYERIGEQYRQFLDTDRGRSCIALFDGLLPEYKDQLTDVKKLDFLLWSQR